MTWTVFNQQPTLIGHRGMGAGVVNGYRENTVDSFLAALDSGIDWVEVDVRRTNDDELFVWHDAAIDGKFMADITSSAAARLGAIRVETLLEALPSSAGVVFDVKSSMQDAMRTSKATTATLLAATCNRALGNRPALAQSFDPAALAHIRETLPTLALGLLTWIRFPIHMAISAAAHLDVQVLAVHAGSLAAGSTTAKHDVPPVETVVEGVHAASRQIMVWCPSERRAGALARAGVDAIVVDDSPKHVRALSSNRA